MLDPGGEGKLGEFGSLLFFKLGKLTDFSNFKLEGRFDFSSKDDLVALQIAARYGDPVKDIELRTSSLR